jgi:DNA-binding response OmpR family regulator
VADIPCGRLPDNFLVRSDPAVSTSGGPGASRQDERLPSTAELSRTVLAVDDEASIRMWLMRSLNEFGYDVLEAADRATARAMLQRSRVDAMILDIRLARGSGLEVLHYVRTREELAALPVIILTGVSQLTPEEEAFIERHQAHLFYKPEGIESIAEKLDQLLRGANE